MKSRESVLDEEDELYNDHNKMVEILKSERMNAEIEIGVG